MWHPSFITMNNKHSCPQQTGHLQSIFVAKHTHSFLGDTGAIRILGPR
jgi:hypothetical protein